MEKYSVGITAEDGCGFSVFATSSLEQAVEKLNEWKRRNPDAFLVKYRQILGMWVVDQINLV